MQPGSRVRRDPQQRNARSVRGAFVAIGRVLLHGGFLVAGIAGVLAQACAAALGGVLDARAIVTIVAGTAAVYAFDRRIDDCVDRPHRDDFDRCHRVALTLWSATTGSLAVATGLGLPSRAVALLAVVAVFALLHARVRRIPWIKPVYLAGSWLAVVVVLPAVVLGASGEQVIAELAPIGLAIVANVIACDAIDREAEAMQIGVHGAWWVARIVAWSGVVAGLSGPATTTALAVVPAVMGFALVRERRDPAYKPVLDAALGLGAALAWLWMKF